MSGRKGVIAAGVAMLSRASNQLFLIAVTLVATRYLGPADFGVFALATTFITLARTLLYAGPFEYLMKARELERSASECLAATVLLAGAAALVLVGIAAASPWIFGSTAVRGLMLLLAPSILLAAFASWEESLLLRGGRVRDYYLVTAAVELISAAVAIGLLIAHFGLIALVVQNYVRITLLGIAYYAMQKLPKLQAIGRSHLTEILGWSTSRYGTTMVAFLSNYSGDLILGAVLSPAATGLYRASNRVVTAAADVFGQPARMIAMTSLSRQFAAGKPADGRWTRIFAGIAVLGWPALIGVATLGDMLAPVMLGPQWAGAGPVIAIIAITRLASLLSAVTSTQLVAYDRQRKVFWVQLAGAIGVAVATLILAPVWGVKGAALSALVVLFGTGATLLVSATAIARPTGAEWRRMLTVVGVPSVATAIGALTGRFGAAQVTTHSIAQLAIAIGCGAIGWAVAVLVLRRPVMQAVHALGHHDDDVAGVEAQV